MGLGRVLITAGLVLVVAGVIAMVVPLGRLPGDFRIHGKNSSVYFPLATCLLLSLVFSLLMWLFKR